MRRSLSLIALVASLAAAQSLPAQKRRFVQKPKLPAVLDATQIQDEVVIKFHEGSGVRLRGGRFVSLNGTADTSKAMEIVGSRKLGRFFTRAEKDLDREREEIRALLQDGEEMPAELNLYFVVKTSGKADSENLINALNEDAPSVEVAYADAHPERGYVTFPDIPPPTPDWTGSQRYQGAPPNGTNAAIGWRIVGGRGENITVGHLEGGWRPEHEDIEKLKNAVANRFGGMTSSSTWVNHGTACVGIMNATHNPYGVNGYADKAKLIVAGIFGSGRGYANVLNLAARTLKAGDVLSSSFGGFVRCGSRSYGVAPEGQNQGNFDATQNATKKGIIYTFASGNSRADFDWACWNGIWDLTKRDSGALMIAASNTSSRTRISFSNYGSRMDAHAWGTGVYTTGYGNLFGPDLRQRYSRSFGGTSAAAPQVAGACAVFVSAYKEQFDKVPTPKEMRDFLRKYGSPGRASDKIGSLPDLKKMLAAIGLPDGLQITKDPVRGSTMDLTIAGKARGGFVLFGGAKRGRLNVGLNRDFLLDLATSFIIEANTFGNGTSVSRKYPIPNDPALRDLSILMQAATWDASAKLHMTSSARGFIRK